MLSAYTYSLPALNIFRSAAHSVCDPPVCVCADSPVYDAMFVQVLHCGQDLSGVTPHLPLLQPLPLTDPVHQVSSSTELHGHVVAVLRLQSLTHK